MLVWRSQFGGVVATQVSRDFELLYAAMTFLQRFTTVRLYAVYVLLVLLVAFLLDQMARYTLGVVAQPVAQTLKYGDKSCMANTSNLHYRENSNLFTTKCTELLQNKNVPLG